MYYSEAELKRLYKPGETMHFSRGRVVMTAETAERFAYGLVTLDRGTGCYRRASLDSGSETAIINAAKYAERMKAAGPSSMPSAWSSRRP